MNQKIFVNLPVADLAKSKAFFAALGYTFNAQFTNDLAASMVVSEDIYVMLLTHEHFTQFITLPIADAHQANEVLVSFALESRAAVDAMVAKAVAAGGKTYKDPMNMGFMYGHGFKDPDGHVFEYFWMDPAHIQQN